MAELSCLLKHPYIMTKILNALSGKGKSARQLEMESGVSSMTISRKMRKLTKNGLVLWKYVREGYKTRLYYILNKKLAFEKLGLNEFWERKRLLSIKGRNRNKKKKRLNKK